ncbi:MAG: DNA-3-methyladenine glycosylase [Candidatus Obscuribacterales bacterium]|nr:DNA-3-methyladenine glycosylase [Candidatus Obscuribacterales bacterium]
MRLFKIHYDLLSSANGYLHFNSWVMMKETKSKPKVTRRFESTEEPSVLLNQLPFDSLAAAKIISKADKNLARVIKAVGPCRLELQAMQNSFESLLESIVYQQLTGKAAATILGRVKALYKDEFPSPAQVLKTTDETFRSVGLSGAKTAAIKDLADKSKKGLLPDIDALAQMSDDEIIEKLTAVRGIGEWTVHMLLIFRLGRPDVMPNNDYGIRKGFARAYELDDLPSPRFLLEHSEIWRPYRSIASWYLWRVLDLK